MITELRIKNFKSIARLRIPLQPLTAFVGANASGKSNIVDALAFLRDCVSDGIMSAITVRGGWEQLVHRGPNEHCGPDKELSVALRLGTPPPMQGRVQSESINWKWLDYQLTIARTDENEIRIQDERLSGWHQSKGGGQPQRRRIFTRGKKWIFSGFDEKNPRGKRRGIPKGAGLTDQLVLDWLMFFLPHPTPELSFGCFFMMQTLKEIKVYNISPSDARKSTLRLGAEVPGETGRELAAVLHSLKRDQERSELLTSFMQATVPGFKSFDSTIQDGVGVIFTISEDSLEAKLYPQSMSDGTVRLLAYLAASSARDPIGAPMTFEEPERSLHPHLLELLLDHFREVSQRSQVLLTTHSPVFLDWLQPEELVIVSKEHGATSTTKATSLSNIRSLSEAFGLGTVWTRGSIGGIPE